jgi:hypothetical protein
MTAMLESIPSRGVGSRSITPDYAPILFPSVKLVSPKSVDAPKDVLVFGVGVDDSTASQRIDDIAYTVWYGMLERCYSPSPARRTYAGCTVDACWHTFSDFKAWYDLNHVSGYQLDKDILFPGNNIYSPETCVIVPPYINQAVRWRRDVPKAGYAGVTIFGAFYQASITHKGVSILGECRSTSLEAHCDWQRLKANVIDDHLLDYLREMAPDLRVVRALIKYADLLRRNASQCIPSLAYQH